ncbi:hypothetical protein ACHAWF_009703 [Thalassiosira exigua]
MPRFSDQWVVDRAMFDYVQGGSCACCGLIHLFAPGGLEGMINSMSDLETDAAAKEFNAAKASPWPPDMRDSIWSDRLLLRFRMKKEMRGYREFFEGVVRAGGGARGEEGTASGDGEEDAVDPRDAMPALHDFCLRELSMKDLRGIFQMPRTEVTEELQSRYKICGPYGVVFCGVVEQVANFKVTGFGIDARTGSDGDDSEEIFEKELRYKKIGPGFCLDITTPNGEVDEAVLTNFLRRTVSLAGPTLLARAPKTSQSEESDGSGDDGGGGADDPSDDEENNTASFRSDRRVARLIIARCWADRLVEKYNEVRKKGAAEETEPKQ